MQQEDTMAPSRTTLLPLFLTFFFCRSAWAKLGLTMHQSVEVFLGDSAHIPCQYNFNGAKGEPSSVTVQWFVRGGLGGKTWTRIFYGDNNQQIVDNGTDYSDRIEVVSDQQGTSLTIQGVRLSDEREFFCMVKGVSAGNAAGKTWLRVFVVPEAPVIEGVTTGISLAHEMPSKVASCEVRNGFPQPNITWYRNNVLLVSEPRRVNVTTLVTRPGGLYSVRSTLQYKVVKEDKDASFTCEVSYAVPDAYRTAESKSVGITVHRPTPTVKLSRQSPQGLVKEGDTVVLRCKGNVKPPPPFIFNREQEPDRGLNSSCGVLILYSVSRKDGGIYRCRPLDDETLTGELQLTVHYLDPAVMVPKDSEVMLKGGELTATCNALSSLKTSTVWYKDGQQVGTGNTLHLKNASYETTGAYVCKVTVPSLPGLHTSGSVHIIVQGGPQLVGVGQEVQLEEVEGRMVNLSCEARGYPLPSISWNIVGSRNWHEVVNKASDFMTHSVVSVEVMPNISALCNASNDMGTEVKFFSIKSIPPTRVTSATLSSPAKGVNGVTIVVIIQGLILLAILGIVLYFLLKKGKILCGRSGKQEIFPKKEITKGDIVVVLETNMSESWRL